MEQNGPELEEFWLQTKAFLGSYLPIPFFFLGSLIKYLVLRLLPGYDVICVRIHESLHAPSSVLELLEHKSFPGAFPPTPSQNMLDEIRNLLSAKDKEIAALQNNLQNEDDELAHQLAENDEEISMLQNTLQQKDAEIADLQGIEMRSDPQRFSCITNLSSAKRSILRQDSTIPKIEEQLLDDWKCKKKLNEKVAALGKQTRALKKELSHIHTTYQNKEEEELLLRHKSSSPNSIKRTFSTTSMPKSLNATLTLQKPSNLLAPSKTNLVKRRPKIKT